MTPQQTLACNAQQILNCFRQGCQSESQVQSQLMAALIAYVAQANGMAIDCATLQNNAAQFQCLPRQLQLPALIWLFANAPGQSVGSQIINGIGSPTFTPTFSVLYSDNTIPEAPNLWLWNGSAWVEVIA